MDKVREVMQSMGALPKLRLGEKLQNGGVKSFGPKKVKFLSEPEGMTKRIMGKPQKVLRFELEEEGTRYHWYVPVLNREGQPNYLLERLVDLKPGDERILEMSKQGAINYIDVRMPGEEARKPEEDEGDVIDYGDDEEAAGGAAV